jgi:3-hydroxybutyryl-CoA dehydrogenase
VTFGTVSVFGAGTMGHGIAQVCAQAGSRVWLHDVDQARVDAGLAHIKKSLDKGVEKGKVTAEAREATLGRIRGTTRRDRREPRAVKRSEDLSSSRRSSRSSTRTPKRALLATNTSSLASRRSWRW